MTIKIGSTVEVLDGAHQGEQGKVRAIHKGNAGNKAEVRLDCNSTVMLDVSRLSLVDTLTITPTTEGTPMQGTSQPDMNAAASILVEAAVDVDSIQELVDSVATELEQAIAAVAAARKRLAVASKVLPGLQREALAIARLKLSQGASVAELKHRAGVWASK